MAKREVRCEACGTLNRVARYAISKIPRCGKEGCNAALPELAYIRWLRRFWRLGATVWIVGTISVVILWAAWDDVTAGIACMAYSYKQPKHGIYARYSDARPVVPLTI